MGTTTTTTTTVAPTTTTTTAPTTTTAAVTTTAPTTTTLATTTTTTAATPAADGDADNEVEASPRTCGIQAVEQCGGNPDAEGASFVQIARNYWTCVISEYFTCMGAEA